MKNLLWGAAFVALVAGAWNGLAGCGSEGTPATPTNTDAGGEGGSSSGTNVGPPGSCKPLGAACAAGNECCAGGCDPTTKVCAHGGVTGCAKADEGCATNDQCCTFSCLSGKCSGKQCTADNAACTADGECCGGKCTSGTCTPLNASCKTSGNPCGGDGECCSKLCRNGLCEGAASFCVQAGDTCSSDHDCCGGLCTKQAGALLGTCGVAVATGATGCTPAGQICGASTTGADGLPDCGGECCSRSCRPYAPTGVLICQPPSGCHPTGELCEKDTDCCGAKGTPGSTNTVGNEQSTDVKCEKAPGAALGRCDNGKACSPAGAICRLAVNQCNATDRCCSGTVQTHPLNCKQDSLGIPRCTAESDYDCAAKGPPPPGTACASSADCCNRPCVPNPAGTPPFVCAAEACVPTSGACTTTADCCAGSPCNIPQGASKGTCGQSGIPSTPPPAGTPPPPPPPGGTTCAQYGQQCTVTADCCDGVPCINGYCVYPGPK